MKDVLMWFATLCWLVLLPSVTVIAILITHRLACFTLDAYYLVLMKLISCIR